MDPVTRRVLDRLRRYVEMETPSGDAERIAALARVIEQDLAAAGASVEVIDAPGAGKQLLARVEGREPGLAPIVVLAHMDTVHPVGSVRERPFRVVDGRVEGPGTYDMKAGLAIAVEALEHIRDSGEPPRRPLQVLFTCDEETGSFTSRALIERLAREAEAVLVLEPCLPGGAAKTARKGVGTYHIRVTGRAAHAGAEPGAGASAITEMAHQILHVLSLAAVEQSTTVNVGVVHGGTAGNVVAAEAWAEVDIRSTSKMEEDRVNTALQHLHPILDGTRVEVETISFRPPLERTEGVVALYRRAREVAAELGFELEEGASGGGSDGSFAAAQGTPTLDGLGVDGGGAHSVDEHVLLADISRRVAFLTRLMQTL